MRKALVNAKVFTGIEFAEGKAVLVKNNIIEGIFDADTIPEPADIIDCKGKYLAPGLIDLQIAGAGGYLFSADPTPEALEAITESIVRTGTTGFLLVIPTNTSEVYSQVIRTVRDNPNPALLGLHFEGPFISPHRRGAHMSEYIRKPGMEDIDSLIREADGIVKMLTIAPEVCDGEIIRRLNDNGIVVAAGHSNATFKEAVRGFENGIKTTTHLFNAMSQLHHRNPGLPGAVFQTENIFASIIADGIHVDYNIVSIAKKLLKNRLFLVSDAVEESLHGAYLHVRQKDRFTLPDGTLSGSLLTMLKAVKNCVRNTGITIEEALRMATLYPAALMELKDKGKIAPGYKADLLVFDEDFEVKMVLSDGNFID